MPNRTRFAKVSADAETVARYLPDNYCVIATYRTREGFSASVIAGTDSAGWTLDAYVVPRLLSGLIGIGAGRLHDAGFRRTRTRARP